jgi:tetratricopeptide (TPR) repeat protein
VIPTALSPSGDRFRRQGIWFWFLLLVAWGPLLARAATPEPSEAQEALRTGDYSKAIELGRKIIQDRPRNEDAQLALLRGLAAVGNHPEARQALTNALAENPESLRLLWEARTIFQSAGDGPRAKESTEQVRQLMADRPWGFREPANIVVFGRALLQFGADPKEVLEKVFGAAQRLNGNLLDPWLARGQLALDKHDYPLAAKIWREAAEKFPGEPDVLFGLAQAVENGSSQEATSALERALAINPRHLPSLLMLADQRIDAEEDAAADKLLGQVLAVNPWHPDAWAYRAVLAHLHFDAAAEAAARQAAFHHWKDNPRVEFLIGRKLSQKYRFAEAATHLRQALTWDIHDIPAKIQLAQVELRLGNEVTGWQLASEVHEQDGYDIEAFNLVQLHDVLGKFTTITNADLVVRMEPREASIYGEQALALLERARRQLTTQYGVELLKPTLIEIFDNQKDFGVRTFGMPENPGFLGVCFGRVVTANSPAANTSQPVNWQAVLWHEFCHSVTLTLTHNRMPRWLSEGISVYEEIQADPSWGQHLNPRYREMILSGELTPVSRLSGAFLAPPTPLHLQFAYFEAEWVVEFLVGHYGQDHLIALLQDLRDGVDTATALARRAAPAKELDAEFERFARQRAEAYGPGLDWTRPPKDIASDTGEDALLRWATEHPTNHWALRVRAQNLGDTHQWSASRDLWKKLIDLEPRQSGPDSAYWQWARASCELGDVKDEREAWTRGAALDHEAPEAYQRLIEMAEASKDWPELIRNCHRWLAVNPLVSAPYRFLARANEAIDNAQGAAENYRTLLRLNPPNPADVEFRLAMNLHRAGDPSARAHLLQALQETPRNKPALHLLWEMNRPTPTNGLPTPSLTRP